MQENKSVLFEEKEIRKEQYKEDWYFSVIDVVEALVENNKRPRKYWSDLKQKLILEGFVEVSEKNRTVENVGNRWKNEINRWKNEINRWKNEINRCS